MIGENNNRMKENLVQVLNRLSFLSDLYAVGGAVRDMILERKSDDIDLATSDRPETVKKKCQKRNIKVVETGIDHGTVTVIFPEDESKFEITTFRRDVSTDGRNATVEFADSIEQDLSRRDFTINALAFRPNVVVDPFDGMEDMKKQKIRTVGDPKQRFREDFLRIIRAMRFSSRYGFEIGKGERRAMRMLSSEITENVSVERIVMEIKKAMKDDSPEQFIEEVWRHKIFEDVLNRELFNFQIRVESVEGKRERMIVLLVELARSSMMNFDDIQKRLKLPNDLVRDAKKVGELMTVIHSAYGKDRRIILGRFRDILSLAQKLTGAFKVDEKKFERPNVSLEPIVNGKDLLDKGVEEGPQIGKLIDKAFRIQLEEEIDDKKKLLNRIL